MSTCKPVDTPVLKCDALCITMCPINPQEQKEMSIVPYASVIGSLMYAMMCTRPDICFAVGLVSRYQSNRGREHWKAVKTIFRYLKGTKNYCLCYQGSEMRLIGYSDADWGGDLDQRKSTSGFVFLLNKGAISWCSKKQTSIALSTTEAEFIACSTAVQEAVWLRRFFGNLGFKNENEGAITLHCDNQAAIAYTKDPKFHSRTKHIDSKYNYVRDIIAKRELVVQYISMHQMVADPLTKPIPRDVFLAHVKSLGLRRI
ncbi:secreted RxLR effector protein 161-like [Mercurialis annua]|uniref:secreted RxLR effector protein 161-like n=1 Tax=Mercurialis annua TaxID=3986 RepID=UPI0021603300|nr:secreted RxLR effector protein 161-like [Mercurialis annua]